MPPQRSNQLAITTTSDVFDRAYDELRQLAGQLMLRERANHTLSATALVNEAFLRLEASKVALEWRSHAHFLAAATRVMRRVLIDHARAKSRVKRAGARAAVELDEIASVDPQDWHWLLEVDQAIEQLAVEDPVAAEFIQLRLYGGQNIIATGQALGLRKTAAYQMWDFIESWFSVYRQSRDNHP